MNEWYESCYGIKKNRNSVHNYSYTIPIPIGGLFYDEHVSNLAENALVELGGPINFITQGLKYHFWKDNTIVVFEGKDTNNLSTYTIPLFPFLADVNFILMMQLIKQKKHLCSWLVPYTFTHIDCLLFLWWIVRFLFL